ncbi:MAG: PilT/PilU family type 4a pilus ATPase [Burkholderiaceae bacterium]|jgi:twitching motility protein PilU
MHDPLGYIETCLKTLRARRATDLFLTVACPPTLKLDGANVPLDQPVLSAEQTEELARLLMKPEQWQDFKQTREANFAQQFPVYGRFRVNVFVQKGHVGIVMREICEAVPQAASLGIPASVLPMVMLKRGLILIVGSAGSGKTTTLAALVDHRNRSSRSHIVSLEDPIEFIHQPQGCIVTQREIGSDTESWASGLKNALRQSPDMMVIGEIRDRATMEYALNFAETGHLCLATLHCNNSSQAIERILNLFPEERQQQAWLDLSMNLRAIVGQRLVPLQKPGADGKGRMAVHEVLVNTPLVADLLLRGELHSLREIMDKGRDHGMQTFDQALFDLYERDLIRYEDCLRFAESVNDLKLSINLRSQRFRQDTAHHEKVKTLSLI